MAFRVFCAVLVFLNCFVAYKIFHTASLVRGMEDVPAGYGFGPAKADVTIVGFVDYDCASCRAADAVLMEAIKKDGNVRYLPRPLPSTTPGSEQTVRFVYATGLQGKFPDVHKELMKNYRALDEKRTQDLAARFGLDREKLVRDMNSDAVTQRIQQNAQVYGYANTRSLPVFVLVSDLVFKPGNTVPSIDSFITLFREARSGH